MVKPLRVLLILSKKIMKLPTVHYFCRILIDKLVKMSSEQFATSVHDGNWPWWESFWKKQLTFFWSFYVTSFAKKMSRCWKKGQKILDIVNLLKRRWWFFLLRNEEIVAQVFLWNNSNYFKVFIMWSFCNEINRILSPCHNSMHIFSVSSSSHLPYPNYFSVLS